MDSSLQPLRFAIVGFGHIGQRHAKVLAENSSCVLTGICDIDPDRQADNRFDCTFFTDIDMMLAHTDADIISVCTPNYLHVIHGMKVLEAGFHLLMEKPLTLHEADCCRLIASAGKAGKHIFPVMQNRFNPAIIWAEDLLKSGRLGKISLVQVNCFWNRDDNYYAQSDWRGTKDMDGGVLYTQFSHFVDILLYLNGDICDIDGVSGNLQHQKSTELADTGAFVMTAANGSLVNFNFTTNAFGQNMEGSITLFGSNGTVKIGGQYLNKIEYCQVGGYDLSLEAVRDINGHSRPNNYGTYQGSMSNHDKVIQNIVDFFHVGKPFYTTAAEGCKVVQTIERMYQNSRPLLWK